MPIARIVDGTITEERAILIADVPEHKRSGWLPIEGERPVIDGRTHTITGPVYQIEAARVLRVWTVTARDLATVKAETKARISSDAEANRHRYITPGSGKAMSYQQVAQEAIRYGATGGAGAYPFLRARVASGRYPDLPTAAAATQQIEAQWAAIGSAIDQVEDAAKIAIDAATTVEQVLAATVVTWP
jgi:hypothetical protein